MKRNLLILLLALLILMPARAQRVTHRFENMSMPEALHWLNRESKQYTINFIYDELEDFRVTANISNLSVPDAIRRLIGFYPILLTVANDSTLAVECMQKDGMRYKGRIIDEAGQPAPYANIALLSPQDSTLLATGVSNESGWFVIPCTATSVLARVSYVGYRTHWQPCSSPAVGTIHLIPEAITIKGVVVRGERPTVTYHGDRFSVDIRNTLLARGNDGESLLRQLPGVWAEEGGISINGVPGARLMVDDRTVTFSGEQLAAYLRSLRSEDIDKIEIIPHPSAEFPAEGSGGIIRILSRKRERGQQIQAGSGLGLLNYNALTPYLQYAWNSGRWSGWTAFSGTIGRGRLDSDDHSDDRQARITHSNRLTDRMVDHIYQVSTLLACDLTRRDQLSLYGNWMYWSKNETIQGVDNITGQDVRRTRSWNFVDQKVKTIHATLNYKRQLDKPGNHQLLIMGDVSNGYGSQVDMDMDYLNLGTAGDTLSHEQYRNRQPIGFLILSAEGRYTWKTRATGTLMTGTKYSYSKTTNGLSFHELAAGGWQAVPSVGYHFAYREQLWAHYLKYDISRKQWNLTLGLRSEYDAAHEPGKEARFNHFDLFPSLYLTVRPGTQSQWTFSADRRTRRISYIYLIPSKYYESKYIIQEGNPDLRPNYINTLSLMYGWKNKYYLTMAYQWSNNGTERHSRSAVENGQTVTIKSRVDGVKYRGLSLSATLPVTVTAWWKTTNSLTWSCHERLKTATTDISNADFSLSTNQYVTLPWAINWLVQYRFMSDSRTAYGKTNAYHTLNTSLTKSLCHDRLTCKLSVSDLICTQKSRSSFADGHLTTTSAMYGRRQPDITLSVFCNINRGKKQPLKSIEKSNQEEQSRAL